MRQRGRLRQAAGAGLIVLAVGGPTRADDVGGPTSRPADKSRYTLFDPVPDGLLRGMDTDRPNVVNTPHTVDAGHVQVEAGGVDYTNQRTRDGPNDDARSDAFAFGLFDVRLGLLDRLEANVVVGAFDLGRTRDYVAGRTTRGDGFGDASAGLKLNLWGDDGADGVWATGLAVQPQFLFPTASSGGVGRFEAVVDVPFQVNLPGKVHLGLQLAPSYLRETTGAGHAAGLGAAVSVDRTVVGDLDVYLEYAATPTAQRHVKVPQTIDVGGTYPLSTSLMLDVGVNLGLNRASANVEATAGVSVRF